MMKVRSIVFSRLLKAEVQVLLEDVIHILNKQNLEALRLQDFYDILVGQASKIQFFTEPYGKHPLTIRLAELRKERLSCASFIAMQVRSFEKSASENLKEKALLAKKLSEPFLTYLGQKSQYKVGEHIVLFFMNLDDNPENYEAYTLLGLKPYVDELRSLNKEYFDVYKERAQDKWSRPPTGDRALEKETQRKLRQFFEQVNSSQATFLDVDYSSLISELNTTLAAYSKSINTRIATNKRRARKRAEAEAEAAKKAGAESIAENKNSATPSEPKPLNDNQVGVGDSSKSIEVETKDIDIARAATEKKAVKKKEIPVKKVRRV